MNREEKLSVVFDCLIDSLLRKISEEHPKASYLNVARQLLKDHDIQAAPGKSNEFDKLVSILPEFDDENDDMDSPVRAVN